MTEAVRVEINTAPASAVPIDAPSFATHIAVTTKRAALAVQPMLDGLHSLGVIHLTAH